MERKKIEKKTIIALIVIWFSAIIAFVMVKTTIGAGLIACLMERVSVKDYVEIAMMPDNYNFKSYKDQCVHEIRVDKAEKRRLKEEKKRKELAYEFLQAQANQVKDSYTYIQETATEAENLEKYNAYVNGLEFHVQTENEKRYLKDFIGHIAKTSHYSKSTDAYYVGYIHDATMQASNDLQVKLINSTAKENIVIEQISPGEYDPKPKNGLAKKHSVDLEATKKVIGEEQFDYDYIVEFTSTYEDDQNIPIMDAVITAIVSEKNYLIIKVETVLKDETYEQVAAYGYVRPFIFVENVVMKTPKPPKIIKFEELEEKAGAFASLFQEMVSTYYGNEEVINELYSVNFFTTENAGVQNQIVVGAQQNDNGQKDYDSTQFAKIDKDLQAKIESTYSSEIEWGTILVLQSVSGFLKDGVSVLLTERYLNDPSKESAEPVAEEENTAEIYEQAQIIRNIYTNMKEPVLVDKKILSGGNEHQGDVEIAIVDKNLNDVMSEYIKGGETWVEAGEPEPFVAGYFKYNVEGVCSLDFIVLGTAEGCYITDVGIDWIEEKGMFGDFNIATYSLPNTILMEEEAKSEISRGDYMTDKEYNYAIALWLYQEYPDYYPNPSQLNNSTTSSSSSYGNSYVASSLFGNMSNIDVIGSVGEF